MPTALDLRNLEYATVWTTLECVAGRAINVLFNAFFARLLTQRDFGRYALRAISLGVIPIKSDGMTSAALHF